MSGKGRGKLGLVKIEGEGTVDPEKYLSSLQELLPRQEYNIFGVED